MDRRKALKIAQAWEKAARIAAAGELTQAASMQLLDELVSRLANLEVLPDVRKQLAGHSSDEIHRRYVHLDLSLQAQAIGKLPSVLPKT